MPTFDGGHCFLTALVPIETADVADRGSWKSSHVQMVREALAVLPTAHQSPVTEKLACNSPYFPNPMDIPSTPMNIPKVLIYIPTTSMDIPSTMNIPNIFMDIPITVPDIPKVLMNIPNTPMDIPSTLMDIFHICDQMMTGVAQHRQKGRQ